MVRDIRYLTCYITRQVSSNHTRNIQRSADISTTVQVKITIHGGSRQRGSPINIQRTVDVCRRGRTEDCEVGEVCICVSNVLT